MSPALITWLSCIIGINALMSLIACSKAGCRSVRPMDLNGFQRDILNGQATIGARVAMFFFLLIIGLWANWFVWVIASIPAIIVKIAS